MSMFLPWAEGEFYTVSCNSVDHVRSGGRSQKWVWDFLGAGLVRHPAFHPHHPFWRTSYVPSEDMKTLRLMFEFPNTFSNGEGGIFTWECYVREYIYIKKSTIWPSQGLHFIELVPYPAQIQLAASSDGCWPSLHVAVTLQTPSQNSTSCFCKLSIGTGYNINLSVSYRGQWKFVRLTFPREGKN